MARFAAVDIGSNSMRLLVAETTEDGKLLRLAEDRQVTRLGESVFSRGLISEEAIRLTEEVLTRFRLTIGGFGAAAVRAVATSATRDAGNQEEFLTRAKQALGAPIEIISGIEEARLIGLGVHAIWPQEPEPLIIVDVGGGSAEFILMDQGTMVEGYSRPLGAVRLKEVFLDKDPPKREQVHRLQEFIDEKLELVVRRLGGRPFARAIATSASAAAIVCAVNGIPRSARVEAEGRHATLEQVRTLYRELMQSPIEKRRKMVGIGPKRAEILVAGVAVFLRAMERLDLPRLDYCGAGVREGIIADLATRGAVTDSVAMREGQRRVVEVFAKRFGVDLQHARQTAAHAAKLFERLRPLHKLDRSYVRLLEAACYLLDVGHYVSDTGHHKHSHYLVAHADLPGFTATEKQLVALLCRFHRKSMPASRHVELLHLSTAQRRALELLAAIVRVADALDRSRDQHVTLRRCEVWGDAVVLTLEAGEGKDYALEEWAVERCSTAFRSVYDKALLVARP
ncbi:Ppx/GppA phosphatase family protein [Bryobacter aggregatus]|uniref:Ppx/GppA phosphatase family protein n=1 Tax=Bryobacter aggregatus TaxID=360054 RepID=UPI0004E22944|nr:Ppx/GppA phosphatase family protein [Bryobacter aggregatus]